MKTTCGEADGASAPGGLRSPIHSAKGAGWMERPRHRLLSVATGALAAVLLARGLSPMAAGQPVEAAAGGNAVRGKALFEKRCTGCHALDRNLEGPALKGVYGRTSGTATGFAYSAAVRKAGVVWDAASLDKWLTDPDAFIPGNEMDFSVADAQERMDVIVYLRQFSGR